MTFIEMAKTCAKKYIYLFLSILFFTLPMSMLDVTSDGINSWDQMGYNASGILIHTWLDPLMDSFCDHFGNMTSKGREGGNNNDDRGSCEGYYDLLSQRYEYYSLKIVRAMSVNFYLSSMIQNKI